MQTYGHLSGDAASTEPRGYKDTVDDEKTDASQLASQLLPLDTLLIDLSYRGALLEGSAIKYKTAATTPGIF